MNSQTVLPPQDLAAEMSVLGCLLMGGGKWPDIREILQPTDFYSDVNQIVYRAIARAADKHGGDADAVLVADELRSSGEFEDIGGAIYLRECFETVPYDTHARHYAGIVAAHSRRRQAIAIGEKLIRDARDVSKNDQEVVETAHDSAMQMAQILRVNRSRPRPMSEHVSEVIEMYRQGVTPAKFWGIPAIDEMIGGTMPGELILIGARPSMGKSLVALQWLDHAAMKGIPGLIISEEMAAASLATRSLSAITDLPSNTWTAQADRLSFDAQEHFADRAPLLIAEKCASATGAERAIARAVQSDGVRIVGVDYAQLLTGKGETKEQRVSDVSSRMKAAAMRHDIVILLLAQLNRQIEIRKSPPQLSDLRDSGGLEQDCDVALFPFWPFKSDESYKNQTEYRIYCRKNRNRGIGQHVIQMRIRPERQRLEGISNESETPDEF